ncbi:adenylate kinase [Salinisphaera sp. USBA-960]|uniref:adenylate kinase n=1 Tax=Salinisphaera orenii TaxID=856731 RepID=UPI000DBE0355|nr:adenylate kinase [Salifodinibacter halophilus]NNC26792.1 adenylate kinase [Salifodinibacter halophilus]
MKIVLLGAPGSGKGTQGAELASHYGVPKIASGDLLREAVASGSELGQKAKAAMDAGELVSDDTVIGMIRERLNEPDAQNGFILDGFPRSLAQAEALDQLLDELSRPLQRVIHMQVDNEEIVGRLAARGRADDTEEAIRNRLAVFAEQTEPLVTYYEQRGLLTPVNATGDIDAIQTRLIEAIEAA